MKPVKIFVEGKSPVHSTDSGFLRDCIQHWFNKTISLPDNFKHIGGASEFKDMAPDIRLAIEKSYKVILIIDADDNPAARKKEIEEFQARENLKFPYFLFPDDTNGGEVEHLLTQIAIDKARVKCYEDYERCVGVNLDIKDKVFAYIQAVTGDKEAAKDKNRNFLKGHFDLNDACLEPLKKFLTPYF